jgi:hypothetical protein
MYGAKVFMDFSTIDAFGSRFMDFLACAAKLAFLAILT